MRSTGAKACGGGSITGSGVGSCLVVEINVIEEVGFNSLHHTGGHAMRGESYKADLPGRLVLANDVHASPGSAHPLKLLGPARTTTMKNNEQ